MLFRVLVSLHIPGGIGLSVRKRTGRSRISKLLKLSTTGKLEKMRSQVEVMMRHSPGP